MVFLLNPVVMGQKRTVAECLGGVDVAERMFEEERRMYSQEMFNCSYSGHNVVLGLELLTDRRQDIKPRPTSAQLNVDRCSVTSLALLVVCRGVPLFRLAYYGNG